MNENELKHYGVLGMKWGRRKAQSIRNRSSAYDVDERKWTKYPDGGIAKKQTAVQNAKARVLLSKNKIEKTNAKKSVREAKKELNYKRNEHDLFIKDMHDTYGKTKNYVHDSDNKRYIHKKTLKPIKEYEYAGMKTYESYKKLKTSQIRSKAVKGAAAVAVAVPFLGMVSFAKAIT